MPCTSDVNGHGTPDVNGDVAYRLQLDQERTSGTIQREASTPHRDPPQVNGPGGMTTSSARLGQREPRRVRNTLPALIIVRFPPTRLMDQLVTLNCMLHNTKPALRQCVLAGPAQFMGIGMVATAASRSCFVRLPFDPDSVCALTLANSRRFGPAVVDGRESVLARGVTIRSGRQRLRRRRSAGGVGKVSLVEADLPEPRLRISFCGSSIVLPILSAYPFQAP